jgi:hypothetical protein
MKTVSIAFAACVLAITFIVTWNAWSSKDALQVGTFVILALTLTVLVWYAYDTNAIARVTRERWQRDGVLGTTLAFARRGQSTCALAAETKLPRQRLSATEARSGR